MDHHRKTTPISPEVALANDVFDQFCAAATFKSILGHYRHLCELLHVKPTNFPLFYPKLKAKLRSWKAQALWNKYDKRATHKCYNRGKACPNTRVLIIGAGPCGLRAAIEAQLLGAKVVVVEKRDRISRNNVLHLWPFVIQDLRALGAKKFFGKFCAGSIDHISIRQLQCILLKVALIFGVEIHEGVSFEGLVSPSTPDADDQSDERGWRAEVIPSDHPVSQYEFDVLIGADGKRNTLEGFKRKEFRGKLAIAITANFINRRSEAEARVEEISGVAFIFNQKFFKDLYGVTGIDLENIVYYKDDTHYFVMTAKKHSLLDKGVILNDYADTARLLSPDNVDKTALMEYAREAADFSTNYKLPQLEFAVNHYGHPDVAMFDFTSMYAAENASRVVEKNSHRLLMTLVGDSLLEPFWPTGSGCARGFLSSMDACWAVRGWGMGMNPLEVLAERESIYRILGQTTPENLHRDYGSYTLDPHTRYPNLNSRAVLPLQARGLYITDNPDAIEQCLKTPTIDIPKKRRRRDSQVHPDTLLHWLKKQVALYDGIKIEDMTNSFKDGLALCAIIHRYRPDLLDFHSLRPDDVAKNNQLAFDTLERELGIPPVMTGLEMAQCEVPDKLAMLSYLSQLYDTFRGEIPHIKHPKLEEDEVVMKKEEENNAAAMSTKLRNLTPAQRVSLIGKLTTTNQTPVRKRHAASTLPRADNVPLVRRARKRRSAASDRERPTVQMIQDEYSDRQKVREEIEQNRKERMMRRMYLRHLANQQFHKSMQMLQSNARNESESTPFEDYSLFVYRQTAPDFKDRVKDLERKMNPFQAEKEAKLQAEIRRGAPDGDFSGRIKNLEAKLKGTIPTDKKPKDLLRAIGKIEKTDWNVKEIEKKIEENKMGRGVRARQEKVPKWSREQFADKFSAVERKLKARSGDLAPNKYSDIDVSLKKLEQKIKEGSVLEQGRNKVSAMAAQLAYKNQQETEKPVIQKSNSRAALVLPAQGGSEICHFCNKRVYLMERLSAEGRFFHRGCFRCEYCSTTLRLGSYAFDRDGKFGSKFFCTYHFGLQGTQRMRANRKMEESAKVAEKENIPKEQQTPNHSINDDIDLDTLDRGTTPERVEFENLTGLGVSDEEEAMRAASEMDEDEWTDRNFGASAAEGSSDDISDLSDSEDDDDDDDDDDAEADFAEALTADETLRLAENWTRRHSHGRHDNDVKEDVIREDQIKEEDESGSCHDSDDSHERFSYQEYDSEDDESDTATEGEEEVKARELRKKEVELQMPERQSSDSGSETEVASDDYSESLGSEEEENDNGDDDEEEEEENSATEIETDSEFEHDGSRPEIPDIVIGESVQVKKGKLEEPRKVKVLTRPLNGKEVIENKSNKAADVQLEFTPLVPEKPTINNIINNNNIPSPLINPRRGDYLLNRTHSTEGIASKISLELKKRYLLGPTGLSGSVRKSGSASTLDTKFKSLVDQISEHQKLLNPAPEPSPTMQAFLQGADKLRVSPTISPTPHHSFTNTNKKEKELPNVGDFGHVCSLKNNFSSDSVNKDMNNDIELKKDDVANVEKDNNEFVNITDEKDKNIEAIQHQISENEGRPRSPVHETSIVVPDFPRSEINKSNDNDDDDDDDMESDSLSTDITTSSGDEDKSEKQKSQGVVKAPPKVEIHNSKGELMVSLVNDGDPIDQMNVDDDVTPPLDSLNMSVPDICQTMIDSNTHSMKSHSLENVHHSSLSKVDSKNIDLVPKNFDNDISSSSNFSSKIITVPNIENDKSSSEGQILKQVSTPAELFVSDEGTADDKVSGRSSPSSPISVRGEDSESNKNDNTVAILTETELSDWARDEDAGVSENLDDLELNINPQFITFRRHQKPRNRRNARGVAAKIARTEEFDDEYTHVCGKVDKVPTSNLLTNIDNIEFMDTGGEEDTSTDDGSKHAAAMRNSGYIQFVNPTDDEDDITTPLAEALPPIYSTLMDNQEASKDNEDEESLRQNEDTTTSNSETVTVMDSPLIEQQKPICDNSGTNVNNEHEAETNNLLSPCIETSSTTYEEYVKRLQGRISPFSNVRDSIDIRKSRKNHKLLLDNNFKTQEIKEDVVVNNSNEIIDKNNLDNILSSSNLISNKSPETRKLEEISRERSKQKDIVRDMVMNKIMSQGKSSQDRKNKRNSRGSSSPLNCQGSQSSITSGHTNDDKSLSVNSISPPSSPQIKPVLDMENVTVERPKSIATPVNIAFKLNDTLERRHSVHQTVSSPLNKSNAVNNDEGNRHLKTPSSNNEKTIFMTPLTSFNTPSDSYKKRSLSVHSSFRALQKPKMINENSSVPDTPLTHHEAYSLPDIRKALFDSGNILKTPVVPCKNKLAYSEKYLDSAAIRENARKKAQMKTDIELGLSPEDRIKKLKEKVSSGRKDKKSNFSLNHSAEQLNIISAATIPVIVKDKEKIKLLDSTCDNSSQSLLDKKELSTDDILGAASPTKECKSDRKKSKDRDRRKSIIQAVSDFFHKKSPLSPSPPKTSQPGSPPSSQSQSSGTKFSKFRIHKKDKSKSANNSDYEEFFDGGKLSPSRVKSVSESEARRRLIDGAPPVPPPPVNYIPQPPPSVVARQSEDSYSEPDEDSRATRLDGNDTPGGSLKKSGRTSRRMARQAQLKRLRMAQEIQRQLEEVEVKQKELEAQGVLIEKAIRGESTEGGQDESELTQQWFQLMRERNELRRYEHELTVRAQDVELEDTHARLQQELRERLAKDDTEKSAEEVAKEGHILREMLQIVERRDALHALLEEERQRYKEEAKDLEAQMLAKGLRLTSVTKKESNI
ncbi:molecule interacting with CasL isoform X2 [Lycorma delicatula]|uniref:molecule interacting with CasL isoform X2 n=1 Tax=Lycorma delicatula TaxID=130591 RepID=UPI003F50DADA